MSAAASTLASFMGRDWATARSYRAAFALELVGLLLSMALFFYVGRLLDGTGLLARHHVSGTYFGYVVVGMAVMRLVHASLSAFASRLRTDQTTGTLEALLAAPVAPSVVVVASAAFDVLRATIFAVAMIVAAVVVFGLHVAIGWTGAAVLLVAVPACVALFASIGIAIAAVSIVYKQVAGVTGLVTSGLALLSGVYFPLDVLPHPLPAVADAIPFTWAVQLVRAAVLGDAIPLARLAELTAMASLLLPASLALFSFAIDRARSDGSLAHY